MRLSKECQVLGMTTISAAFVKKLEHKLNAALWDAYHDLGQGQDEAVRISVKSPGAKGGKDVVQVALPVADGLRMPYMNRVCTVKMPKAIWCCKVCGVSCLQLLRLFRFRQCYTWGVEGLAHAQLP